MDTEKILTFALIGTGIYAVYKIFNDEGVKSTTSAIGDITQGSAGIFKETAGIATDTLSYGKKIQEKTYKNVVDNPFAVWNLSETANTAEKYLYEGLKDVGSIFKPSPASTNLSFQQRTGIPSNLYIDPVVQLVSQTTPISASSGLLSKGSEIIKTIPSLPPSQSTKEAVEKSTTPMLKSTGSIKTTTTTSSSFGSGKAFGNASIGKSKGISKPKW